MKLLDFLQLPIVQLLRKFYCNILENEGAGDNFLGLTLEKSQILKSQLSRKKEQNLEILQISFVMYCYLVYSIIIIMFWWKLCSKFNLIAIFLILANFAAFLDHTKENADVSKNDGYFKVNFYIFRKYMPEAISTPNLVALPMTSKELGKGGGGLFAPHQNRTYHVA